MVKITRSFMAGRMNKIADQRILPDGEYIEAMNVRMNSTEKSSAGVIENTNGNLPLTQIEYNGSQLSAYAKCIGAIDDSSKETIYWFVHDPQFALSNTGKLDLIVSYNVVTKTLIYHIISVDDGGGVNTTLNFNPQYLITGVNIIEDLLYWTDDYNEPRFINITSSYANPDSVTGVDHNNEPELLYESILVIKRPPSEAPSINLVELDDESNFLEERFICFAYRYRYANNQYSATSQWTEAAFMPKDFQFSPSSYLNEGMLSKYNGVEVTFNTGGTLVVGIDLLFKESASNLIKIIEKYDKADDGLNDNSTHTYLFSNSKIFTILSESEILRLYDNVPLLAKAQTIMGNRLMYGNYVDWYDIKDKNNYPVNFDYTIELLTEEIGAEDITYNATQGIITFGPPFYCPSPCNPYNVLNIDLSGINLLSGYILSFDLIFREYNDLFGELSCNFSFTLPRTYSSVYDMASSVEFQNAIGTALNIKPLYSSIPGDQTSCDGYTFTDAYNCSAPDTLSFGGNVGVKYESGIDNAGDPIRLTTSPGSNIISLEFLAVRYVDNPSAISWDIYIAYRIQDAYIRIERFVTQKSLHSNRDYEIGIVYMDEYGRSTPANVSQFNNVHIPCSYSKYANSIRVTIPPSQIAPYWAKRYKFVCKPDKGNYETIYSNIFFKDPNTSDVYFLVQGENARKVEEGDRYIVKADSLGAKQDCTYATVLEKDVKEAGFLSVTPEPPVGVYMKIKPDGFSLENEENAFISFGEEIDVSKTRGESPIVSYDMNLPDPDSPGFYKDYSVPAGSIIIFDIRNTRDGFGDKACETRIYHLEKQYVSSSDYDSMYDWFVNDNIESTLNDGFSLVGNPNECDINNIFNPDTTDYITEGALCDNYWRFYRNPATEKLELFISGTWACGSSKKRKSTLSVDIKVYRAVENIIFETEPSEALPDVFFENHLSYPIDDDGNHLTNGATGDQDQDISLGQPAIVNTGFFNCFTFGNGAESFKIRDSIVGKTLNLGNRVITVGGKNYKSFRRFADMTYSGVYNPETNFNKLNEFNTGLANFKNLELSFGPIHILDGRETDVLVLQEDRISYVLAGKNLLSDASAGGVITSVPEVLGTQIARTEKYGISFNPESYVNWGYDRYFTDAKRGSVIQLKGNSYSNEQMAIASDLGMKTWFRDEFRDNFMTQKIGGYDPFMNEYVLSINDIKLPEEIKCNKCGGNRTLTFANGEGISEELNYCIDLSNDIGDVQVDWTVISIDGTSSFTLDVVFDGTTYNSGVQTTSGQFTFFKNTPLPSAADVTLNVTGNAVISVNISCPNKKVLNLIEVVLTNDAESGLAVMKQFNYVNGTYTSPLQSNFFIFASGISNPLVSYYYVTNGFEGQGPIPVTGSTMTLKINENYPWASFNFNPLNNKFRYARTSVLYGNNDADMQAMMAASTPATPILNPATGIYEASFTVPSDLLGEYMYIIWDLRTSYEVDMCYDLTAEDACCDCAPCEGLCSYWTFTNPATETETATVLFPLGICDDPTGIELNILPGETFSYCLPVDKNNYIVTAGEPVIYMDSCTCP